MSEFLGENIYVRFGGQLFWQMVGIPMGTNCAPLLADLFLCSYENEFLDKLIKEGKRKLARTFNVSYRYTHDLISFNNKRFKVFWHHLGFMSTISLNFGVHTRNWPRIVLQPLEFNFEFYFWRILGDAFCWVPGRSQNSRSLYQAQNLFKITKNCSQLLFYMK